MIQRTAFPSALTDLAGRPARQAQPSAETSPAGAVPSPRRVQGWWSRTRAFLCLPGNLRSFALFVAAVGIVSGGMALHILLSAQILAARVDLRNIKVSYDATMRQNADLVWQIADARSLPAVMKRAEELGYRTPTDPHYVVRVTWPAPGAEPAARMDSAGPVFDLPAAAGADRPSADASLASQSSQTGGASGWRDWLPGALARDAEPRLSPPARWLELLRSRSSP